MADLDTILECLTQAVSVGYSGDAAAAVEKLLAEEGIPARAEKDGSVSANLKGSGNGAVMIACHIDEIGFIVSRIDDRGRLYISAVGGFDPRILPGQEVVVLGRKRLRGYIAVKPPHLLQKEERERAPLFDDLFIDTGLSPASVRKNVRLGDSISLYGPYKRLSSDLRQSKALDNRASVACGMLILKELAKTEHALDVHFIATSQEEYTGLGATTHAYRLGVDYGVAIDVTHGEHPDLKEYEYHALGSGPAIVRGATVPPRLFELLVETAKSTDIPYQIEPVARDTGTDAEDMAFTRQGIPTCVVSIPLRYMHTPVEVVSLGDIMNTARLVAAFIKSLGDLHDRAMT